jgi:hypothetical protein
MRLTNTGLGIGTTSPQRKLHVIDDAIIDGASGANLYFRPNTSYSGSGNFGIFTTGLTSGTYESTMTIKGYGSGVNDVMTIKGLGNVGIGTSSPSSVLEIADSGVELKITDTRNISWTIGDTVASLGFYSDDASGSSGAANNLPRGAIDLVTTSTFGSTHDMVFRTRGDTSTTASEKLRITSNGSVGIGTNSPQDKLSIEGGNVSINNGSAFQVGGSVSGNTVIGKLKSESGVLTLKADSTRDVQFGSETNGTAMFIEGSNGNVGIGTSSIDAKLHVESANNYNGTNFESNPHLAIDNGTPTNHTAVLMFESSGTDASNKRSGITGGNYYSNKHGLGFFGDLASKDRSATPDMFVNSSGNIGIGTTSPAEVLHIQTANDTKLRITKTGTDSIYAGVNTSPFIQASSLRFMSDSSTERMKIDSSGNVGIAGATTIDDGNLQIGDANSSFNIAIAGTRAKFGYASDNAIVQGGTSKGIAFCVNNNTLGSGEAGRFDTSGNLGIGTTLPSAALNIVKSGLSTQFRVSNTESDATTKYGAIVGSHYTNAEEPITGMLMTSSSSVTGGSVSIGGGISAANAVNKIIFYTAANNTTLTGTERMRITSSGNVGIGTINPNRPLDVESTSQNVAEFRCTTSAALAGDDVAAIELTSVNDVNGSSTSKLKVSDGKITLDADIGATGGDPRVSFEVEGNEVAGTDGGAFVVGTTSNISHSHADVSVKNTVNGDINVHGVVIKDNTSKVPQSGSSYTDVLWNDGGDLYWEGDAISAGGSSDIRLKENIEPITDAVAKVKQLNGCTFNFKKNPEVREAGLIAQDVQKVLPEVVYEKLDRESNENRLALKYDKIISLLVESTKEQQEQIESLKSEIANLKGEKNGN